MLLPVLAMMLACLGFRGMLAYPQVYSLFSGRLMEEKAEMSTQYYLRFGQPSEELGGGRPSGGRCVPAVLLPAGGVGAGGAEGPAGAGGVLNFS